MNEENKKTRKRFTRQFKRKVLLEYANGKKPAEIFSKFNIELTEDKKYPLKLIHKWKRELYENNGVLSLGYINIDLDYAKDELNNIGDDFEKDDILEELLKKNKKNNPL